MSAIDADNGTAIFKLGVGWKNGSYSTATWHIQECCDGSKAPVTQYANNMGQAVNVLNDRRSDTYTYVASSKASMSIGNLDAFIRYAIDRLRRDDADLLVSEIYCLTRAMPAIRGSSG